jgi:hypothetical protein
MHNGPRTVTTNRQSRPAASFDARPRRFTSNRPDPQRSQNAQRNYERYLALAQAQARSGDTIGAENYYQHAEHYFRSMSADRETTERFCRGDSRRTVPPHATITSALFGAEAPVDDRQHAAHALGARLSRYRGARSG